MTEFNQYLFNRAWSFEIGLPGKEGKTYSSSINAVIPYSQQPNQTSPLTVIGQPPTALRIVFDIDKSSCSSSNKAKFEVYNLNAQSRINYRAGYQIRFKAGYVGMLSTVYIGDIPRSAGGCTTRRRGADIITTFECGSAEKELVLAHYDNSYPPGTPISLIFEDLANQLGVTLGPILGIPNKTYNNGFACNGTVQKTLNTLCRGNGLQWNIQDDTLQIMPKGAHTGDSAIVLSNKSIPGLTGLIDIPSEGDQFTTFNSLLNPSLMPGRIVQIYSESINGSFYVVRRAHLKGDTHGTDWTVSCEGTKINARQVLPQQNLNGKIVMVS